MNRGAVYAARALGLCIVVGVLICPCDSSGNLGCRFSPVCSAREICREDKLFGTCAHRSASIFAYDLDPAGYLQLKNAIEFLLSRGYTWDNAFAQHSLKIVLKPYRRELELYNDRKPSLIPNDSDFSSAGVNGLLNDLELLENAEEYEEKLRKSKIATPNSRHKVRQQKPTKSFLHRHGSKTNNNRMSDVLQEMYYEKYLEYMKAMEEESKGRKINTYDEFLSSMTEPSEDQQWEMGGNGRAQGHRAETWQFDDNIGDGQVVDINWLEDNNGEGVKNDEMFEGEFIGGDDEVFNKESSNKNNIETQDYLNDLSLLDIETIMKEMYSLFATVDPDSWTQLTEKEKSLLLDQALLLLLEKYPSLTTKPAENVEIWKDSEEVTETANGITEKMVMEEQERGEHATGEWEEGGQENIIGNEWRTPKIENQPEVNLDLEEPFPKPTDYNPTGKLVNLENEQTAEENIKAKKEHDVFDVHNNLDVDTSAGMHVASSVPSKKDDRIKNQVFIITNESLGQQDGEMVVEQLRDMLQLPEDAFINTRVKKTKVTFTVNTKYNNSASDIAKKAAQLGTELHKRLGPTIRMTGAGSGRNFATLFWFWWAKPTNLIWTLKV
ncbi:uncharacterized protein LOC117112702 [Anneissia japonica]|uniref:uncharacterized protein LOC117112702 n=1 Tax=Anneissia japonica TaxID=1529436 RepID=UPI0014259A20|nr:uncharacterized protein LOC117112702 [Anneissia japonica]